MKGSNFVLLRMVVLKIVFFRMAEAKLVFLRVKKSETIVMGLRMTVTEAMVPQDSRNRNLSTS